MTRRFDPSHACKIQPSDSLSDLFDAQERSLVVNKDCDLAQILLGFDCDNDKLPEEVVTFTPIRNGELHNNYPRRPCPNEDLVEVYDQDQDVGLVVKRATNTRTWVPLVLKNLQKGDVVGIVLCEAGPELSTTPLKVSLGPQIKTDMLLIVGQIGE